MDATLWMSRETRARPTIDTTEVMIGGKRAEGGRSAAKVMSDAPERADASEGAGEHELVAWTERAGEPTSTQPPRAGLFDDGRESEQLSVGGTRPQG